MMDSHTICQQRCKGVDSHDGECCCVEERDWVLGPVPDADDFLERLRLRFGRLFLTNEIFYEFEEGSKLFPDRGHWQKEESYPAIRVNLHHSRKVCMFYSSARKSCSVYDIRPGICKQYQCDFLKEKFDEDVHSCEQGFE